MIKLKLFISLAVVTIISTNSIAQWTIQGSLTGLGTYPSISVYAPSELVVAGGTSGSPKVYRSANSGLNWENITGNITGPELMCVWAVDANLIFAGDDGGNGGNAKVWKTTDGGVTWSVILTTGGTNGYFNGIVFSRTNPLIGIAQSDPPTPNGPHYLAKTTDGGISWNTQTTISTNGAAITGTVVCIDNLFYGWGIYPPARVLLTSDGGITWNQTNISSGGNQTQGFAFSSDKMIGVAVSENTLPFVSRSSNGGVTWTPINTGLPITSNSGLPKVIWVYGTNTCYLISDTGVNGCAGKSTDGGLTWSVMNTGGVTGLININLVFINGLVSAYAISGNGNVIRLIEPLGVIAINSTVPSEYELSQNFPNPFNPTTKIRFALTKTSFAKLVVYDALGREQETLVNQQLTARTYEVDWNASNYPSGVYYYKLNAGNYTETKKMILIK